MVLVAVAGGTSPTLGCSIVTAILASGKHDVVILSRDPDEKTAPRANTKYGAPIRHVKYDSIDSLTSALEEVHTVLSVLKIIDSQKLETVHLNLLRAAIATGTVKRFSPTDYSLGPVSHTTVDLLASKSALLKKCQDLNVDKGGKIEIAQFQTGMFMEYLAVGLPDPDGRADSSSGVIATRTEKYACGLEDDMMLPYIDIARGRLPVPTMKTGGPARITITSIADVGKFVAAAIDLPVGSWKGFMGVAGSTVTFADVRDILGETNAPEIRHETLTEEECRSEVARFEQELDRGFSVEALKGRMVAQMMAAMCRSRPGEAVIEMKEKLWPEVQTVALRPWLKEVWGAKQQ